jgi:hypothetical protein
MFGGAWPNAEARGLDLFSGGVVRLSFGGVREVHQFTGAHCCMNSILRSAGAFEPSVEVLLAQSNWLIKFAENTHASQTRTAACLLAINSENGRAQKVARDWSINDGGRRKRF